VKKSFFQSDAQSEEYWISVSDMMSGLMMVFLLIAVIYMIDVQDKTNEIERVQRSICNELRKEFKDEKDKWNMSICQGGLVVSFQNDAVFKKGSSKLQPRFKKILDNFFPKFMTIVTNKDNKSRISELRIEGHTSSEYTEKGRAKSYILNTKLSQNRSYEVMNYVFNLASNKEIKDWMIGNLTAHGMSSSKLLYIDNDMKNEDAKKSRRVEFRIQTNAEAKLIEDLKAKIVAIESGTPKENNPIILQNRQGIVTDNNESLEANIIPNNIGQRFFCEVNFKSTQKIVKFKQIITLYKSENEGQQLDQSWIKSGFSKGVEYSKNYESEISGEDGFIHTEWALEDDSLSEVTIDYLHEEENFHQCKYSLEQSVPNQIEVQKEDLPLITPPQEVDEAQSENLIDQDNVKQSHEFTYSVAKNGMNLYWAISPDTDTPWGGSMKKLTTHCQQQRVTCAAPYNPNIENGGLWGGGFTFNGSGLDGFTNRCIAASYFVSQNNVFQNLIISTGPDAYSANAKALKICRDNNGYPNSETCFVPPLENTCGESKGIYKFTSSDINNPIIKEQSEEFKEAPTEYSMPITNQEEFANQEEFGGLEDPVQEPKSFFDKLFDGEDSELKPSGPQIGQ